MALHPFAEANAQQPTPIATCLPPLMKDDLHHHHHHHHLHELERMSKIPINGKSAWTDAATDVLIDVFEEKWNSLRRGNLKAKNWDEVGAELGSRCGVPKTGDQCRHKIEKLRGKFRQEKVVAVLGQSKWPWYDRLNQMFGGGASNAGNQASGAGGDKASHGSQDQFPHSHAEEGGATNNPASGYGVVVSTSHPQQHHQHQHQHQHHGLELVEARSIHGVGDDERNTNTDKGDTSYTSHSGKSTDGEETRSKSTGSRKRGRESSSSSDLGAALKYLSETLVKLEECKVELQRDNERVRMEMEARRAQMHEVELKRTEMLIQLELKRTEMLCELELRRTKMQMDLFESMATRAK